MQKCGRLCREDSVLMRGRESLVVPYILFLISQSVNQPIPKKLKILKPVGSGIVTI